MQKYLKVSIISIILIFGLFNNNFTLAADGDGAQGWGQQGSSPKGILQNLKDKSDTKKTKLDDVTAGTEGGITGTLKSLQNKASFYIDWIIYLGLSIGTLLIIYNGIVLMTAGATAESKVEDVKKKLINIAIGVIVMTGFFYIIKIVLSLVSNVT